MYVCMYVCMYECMYVCVCVCMCVNFYTFCMVSNQSWNGTTLLFFPRPAPRGWYVVTGYAKRDQNAPVIIIPAAEYG